MAAKNENLPINADIDLHNGGTIKYANEVIAIIAGVAAGEVDGIAGMCTSGGFGDIISRNRNITRGIKVEMGGEEVSVDIYTIVEYGQPIQKVALEVQENVRKAIESMTGLHVVKVDVHVQGVSFEKENQELDKGQRLALTLDGEIADEKPAEEPAETPAEAPETDAAPEGDAEESAEAEETEEPAEDPEDAVSGEESEENRAETYSFAFEAEPEEDTAEAEEEADEDDEEDRDFDKED